MGRWRKSLDALRRSIGSAPISLLLSAFLTSCQEKSASRAGFASQSARRKVSPVSLGRAAGVHLRVRYGSSAAFGARGRVRHR